MDYGTFNPKDPSQWANYKSEAAKATGGINNLPYVLGGDTTARYSWYGEPGRLNTEIMPFVYPGSAGIPGNGHGAGGWGATGGVAGGIDPSTLQQLLGLAGGGGMTAAMLGGGGAGGGFRGAGPGIGIMPSGDEDVSAFGLKGPRTIQT